VSSDESEGEARRGGRKKWRRAIWATRLKQGGRNRIGEERRGGRVFRRRGGYMRGARGKASWEWWETVDMGRWGRPGCQDTAG